MAKQISNIKVQGTIDGVTYYQANGKNFAKKQRKISIDSLRNNPKMENFLSNGVEFGGAAKTAAGFRAGFEKVARKMFDKRFSKRAGKIFKTMINRQDGARGKRPVEILDNQDLLAGFELSANLSLNDVFKSTSNVTINAARNEVTLTIAPFVPLDEIVVPTFATHFELINHISILSDYAFDEEEKGYVPIDALNNGKYVLAMSQGIPLSRLLTDEITVTANLGTITPDASSAIISSVGIQFYEERGGNKYPLANGAAMMVKAIF